MAVEKPRGCGFRKIGGLYLVAKDGAWTSCERFPIPLRACPTCDCRVNFARNFQWITHEMLMAYANPCTAVDDHCVRCPLCRPSLLKADNPSDKSGLIWIGKQHYTPQGFLVEANAIGVSRRISTIPKGLVIGETRIFVAHKQGLNKQGKLFDGAAEIEPGDQIEPAVIASFIPQAIELLVDDAGELAKEDWVKKLVKTKNVKLVKVPADDMDHRAVKKRRTKRQVAADEWAVTQEEIDRAEDEV